MQKIPRKLKEPCAGLFHILHNSRKERLAWWEKEDFHYTLTTDWLSTFQQLTGSMLIELWPKISQETVY